MNVDLDVLSKVSLDPLVAAMGKRVIVLHAGREGAYYGAHLELADAYRKDADAHLRSFVKLVRQLSPRARRVWKGARSREFNVGIQAAAAPRYHEIRLRPETLEAVARVGGSVVITTWAPTPTLPVTTRRSSRKTSRAIRG